MGQIAAKNWAVPITHPCVPFPQHRGPFASIPGMDEDYTLYMQLGVWMGLSTSWGCTPLHQS